MARALGGGDGGGGVQDAPAERGRIATRGGGCAGGPGGGDGAAERRGGGDAVQHYAEEPGAGDGGCGEAEVCVARIFSVGGGWNRRGLRRIDVGV